MIPIFAMDRRSHQSTPVEYRPSERRQSNSVVCPRLKKYLAGLGKSIKEKHSRGMDVDIHGRQEVLVVLRQRRNKARKHR